MTNRSKKLRATPVRNVVRHGEIVATLRRRILEGKFSPGHRLPTHASLERQFGTTPITVQKALSVLRQEGFIRSQQRQGTFVAEKLPHRHHYALAFQFPHAETLSQFYKALRNEAGRFESSGRHFSIFYEIGEHTDTEDYQRLLGFVRSHRLAGLIFAQSPHFVVGTPFLEEPNVPRVIVASDSSRPAVPAVYPDVNAFAPKALDYLAARGRNHVAMMTATHESYSSQAEQFMRAAHVGVG